MDKVSEYLLKRTLEEGKKDESDFPDLDNDEIEEVLTSLGIQEREKDAPKDVIYKTMRSVKEFRLARTNEEKSTAEDNEEYEDYGTVRIKTKSGKEALATLRIKKNDINGTIIIHDSVEEDEVPNAFDTMRIIETTDSPTDKASVCSLTFLFRQLTLCQVWFSMEGP